MTYLSYNGTMTTWPGRELFIEYRWLNGTRWHRINGLTGWIPGQGTRTRHNHTTPGLFIA
jgi:hypothetical protein